MTCKCPTVDSSECVIRSLLEASCVFDPVEHQQAHLHSARYLHHRVVPTLPAPSNQLWVRDCQAPVSSTQLHQIKPTNIINQTYNIVKYLEITCKWLTIYNDLSTHYHLTTCPWGTVFITPHRHTLDSHDRTRASYVWHYKTNTFTFTVISTTCFLSSPCRQT